MIDMGCPRRWIAPSVFAIALALLSATCPAAEGEAASETSAGWRFLWDEGLRLTAPDNVTTFKLGGLFQYDLAWESDDGPHIADSHDWRMIRPNLSGRITKDIDWRVEFDFATPQVRMTDAYVRLSNLPWVKSVRVGHMKEPFSIDQFTSSANVTFPEVALPNALVPARSYGVMVGGPFLEDRMTGYAGVFRNTAHAPSRSASGGEAWAVTGRSSQRASSSPPARTAAPAATSGWRGSTSRPDGSSRASRGRTTARPGRSAR